MPYNVLIKMKLGRGLFGSVSQNGYKCDVIKSAIQKYARRCDFDMCTYSIIEMNLFGRLGKSAEMIRSNMRNRLVIILNEDICITDWKVYLLVDKCLELWESYRYNEFENTRQLIKIVKYFNNVERVRFNSYMKCLYFNIANDQTYSKKFPKTLDIKIKKCENAKKFFRKGDTDYGKSMLESFIFYFEKKSLKTFYWFFKIFYCDNEFGRRERKKKSAFVIWDVLKYYLENDNQKLLYDILLKWFMKYNNSRNENIYYLMNMISFLIYSCNYDWNENVVEIEVTDEEVEKLIERNLNEKIEFDSFVYDKHVVGESKSIKKFLDEGSFVNNKSTLYYKEYFEKLYKWYKMKIENEKKENEDFIKFDNLGKIELCRDHVCCNKAMVFSCILGGKKVALKEMRKSFNYGIDSIIIDKYKSDVGMKKLNVKRIKSDKIIRRIDEKKLSWKDNWKLVNEECIYLVMDYFENVGSLVDNKHLRNDPKVKKDFLISFIYRGLWRLPDSGYTNTLVDKDKNILSIDENNIGSAKHIFGKCNLKKVYSITEVLDTLDFIKSNVKIKEIVSDIRKYKIKFNFKQNFDKLESELVKHMA